MQTHYHSFEQEVTEKYDRNLFENCQIRNEAWKIFPKDYCVMLRIIYVIRLAYENYKSTTISLDICNKCEVSEITLKSEVTLDDCI